MLGFEPMSEPALVGDACQFEMIAILGRDFSLPVVLELIKNPEA
jgi:hypothetical protein